MSSIQKAVYLTRADSLRFLIRVDSLIGARYWILNEISSTGEFRYFDSATNLDDIFRIGMPKFGHPLDLSVGIQIHAKEEIPRVKTSRGFMLNLPQAGIPIFSPGGEFNGEIISGRIAFSLRVSHGEKFFNFHSRISEYNTLLNILKEDGAREHRKFLVGHDAWDCFLNGIPLVYEAKASHLRLQL